MTTSTKEFEGRTALITGGARNIGFAIAEVLAERGANIVLADICRDLETIPYTMSTRNDLEEAVDKLERLGTGVRGMECDVRDENQVKKTVDQVVTEFGGIDFLINNAGVISLLPINEISEKAWCEVVDTCLKGAFYTCKHVALHMIARGFGKIVNISSIAGQRGLGLGVHYCAAKHGVIGLTKALAIELADHRINVNAICQGTTESIILEGLATHLGLDEEPYQHFSQAHLFKDCRIRPIDIGNAVRWLVSEESSRVTGAVINLDAGWSAR